jgi:hypothetical protein
VLAAILLLALASPPAHAADATATTALLAGAWPDTTDSPWRAPAPLSPGRSTPLRSAAGAISLTGAAGRIDGRSAYAGRTVASLKFSLTSRLAAEVRAGLLAMDRAPEFERRSTRSEARLRLGDEARGAWLGTAIEHSLSGARLPAASLLGLGAEGRARGIALSASLEQTVERVRVATLLELAPPADTVEAQMVTVYDTRLATATVARVAGRWVRHRFAVESVAGLTLNRLASPYRWMQSSVTLALEPRVSVYATVGNPAPRWLGLQSGSESRASLGVRLASWVDPAVRRPPAAGPNLPAWRLRHLGEDWQVIEIRARGALKVEVMGDFTGWNPTALMHVRGERWAVAVQMDPGVHQVQVRLGDGPWMPPAGLPTAAGGFNDMVGVFVAQ